MENKREVGAKGEDIVLNWYLKKGYYFVARNFHFHKIGELDIVVFEPKIDTLCICEVKLRKNASFANACCAVNAKKQMTIRKVTEGFLLYNSQYQNKNIRFDVAEVYSESEEVNVIENAF